MAKVRIIDDKEVKRVSLRTTSAREKIWLREFVEKFLEENEDVTHQEMLSAKRMALLRFRESSESNTKCASDCACALLDEEVEEDE